MTPEQAATSWTFDPTVVVLLVGAALLYGRGLARDARRSRPMVSRRAAGSFWCGLALIVIALVSPLDQMSTALLSAHMTQHLLLGLIAPLLLVRGRALRTIILGLPNALSLDVVSFRRRVATTGVGHHHLLLAAVAVGAHVGAFWFWHVPALYDAAIRHDLVHALEHQTMLLSGLVLWSVVGAARWRASTGIAVVVLFVAGLGSGALAALLTLSPTVIYEAHLSTTAPWHLSALEDQQLAGALMWVPGGLVYAVTAVVLLVRWLDAGPSRRRAVDQSATAPRSPLVS